MKAIPLPKEVLSHQRKCGRVKSHNMRYNGSAYAWRRPGGPSERREQEQS